MKTIEQFRAEETAALEKKIRAHARTLSRAELITGAGMPLPEYISEDRTHGAVHLTYRNGRDYGDGPKPRTMADAVALFRQFAQADTVIPFHVLKDGLFTVLHPEARMPAKKTDRNPYKRDAYKSAGYAAKVRVNHSHERHHTQAEIEFFAILSGELFNVSIEFGTGYIGTCPALAPRAVGTTDRRGRTVARSFTPSEHLQSVSDGMISYSYGGDIGDMKTGADHRFLFVADHDEDAPVSCEHACEMLATAAETSKA